MSAPDAGAKLKVHAEIASILSIPRYRTGAASSWPPVVRLRAISRSPGGGRLRETPSMQLAEKHPLRPISAQISVQVVETTKCSEHNFVTPAPAGVQLFNLLILQ